MDELSFHKVDSLHSLTHFRLNKLPTHYTVYWKSFNFNFRYVGLYDLNILGGKKWLNYLQTMETLIRSHILWCLISVCTVLPITHLGLSRLKWVNNTDNEEQFS